jgi:hypothetical protein
MLLDSSLDSQDMSVFCPNGEECKYNRLELSSNMSSSDKLLPNNVFLHNSDTSSCYYNTLKQCVDNTFSSDCYQNSLEAGCCNNIFLSNSKCNTLLSNCDGNIFDN